MNRKSLAWIGALLAIMLLLTACGNDNQSNVSTEDEQEQQDASDSNEQGGTVEPEVIVTDPTVAQPEPEEEPAPTDDEPGQSDEQGNSDGGESVIGEDAITVAAEPSSITVLVNKINSLPKEYAPDDLTYPDVPFIFTEKLDKRKMRQEAAEALEQLFAGAKEDGIGLAGVSGYRSYATQKALFQRYVDRDGLEAASRYSARPGHSEHSTGLAMDVTGSDGKCAATDCFGGTPAALWLADHAHEYGFIIRYPEGKEEITGYKYEPWHLRYVGVELAEVIYTTGLTLEEYFEDAIPVIQ